MGRIRAISGILPAGGKGRKALIRLRFRSRLFPALRLGVAKGERTPEDMTQRQ